VKCRSYHNTRLCLFNCKALTGDDDNDCHLLVYSADDSDVIGRTGWSLELALLSSKLSRFSLVWRAVQLDAGAGRVEGRAARLRVELSMVTR